MLCILIRIISSIQFLWVHSAYHYCVKDGKDFPKLSPWLGVMFNHQWLKLPISQTKFHVAKNVRAIEIRLYLGFSLHMPVNCLYRWHLLQRTWYTCCLLQGRQLTWLCLLSCILCPFWKEVYFKRKEFAPCAQKRAHCVLLKKTPQEGWKKLFDRVALLESVSIPLKCNPCHAE